MTEGSMRDGSMTDRRLRAAAEERLFEAELAAALDVDVDDVAAPPEGRGATAVWSGWLAAAVVIFALGITVAVAFLGDANERRELQSPAELDAPRPLPIVAVLQRGVELTGDPVGLLYRSFDQDLDPLRRCKSLRFLNLLLGDDGEFADDLLAPLAELPRLEHLELAVPPGLAAVELTALLRLSQLRYLTLNLGRALTGADVDVLKRLENIVRLELRGVGAGDRSGIDATTLRRLADMPRLQALCLNALGGCDERALTELRAFHRLRRLELVLMGPQPAATRLGWDPAANSSGLTVGVARILAGLPLLDEVRLESVAVTAAAVRALPERLTGFALTLAPDAGADVIHAIAALPNLRRVGFGRVVPARPFTTPMGAPPTPEEAEKFDMPPQEPVFEALAELVRTVPITEFRHEYPLPQDVAAALADADHLTVIEVVTSGDVAQNAGTAALLLGGDAGLFRADAVAAVTFLGQAEEEFLGLKVHGLGDVDGDGFDDVLLQRGIGATWSAAVMRGGSLDRATQFASDAVLLIERGALSDALVGSCSGAGDLDGDGLADLAVHSGLYAETTVYVAFGGLSGTVSLPDLPVRFTLDQGYIGGGSDEQMLSGVGDANGDGLDDLLVGLPGAPGITGRGAALLLPGQSY